MFRLIAAHQRKIMSPLSVIVQTTSITNLSAAFGLHLHPSLQTMLSTSTASLIVFLASEAAAQLSVQFIIPFQILLPCLFDKLQMQLGI